jgi:hypothetical protein
MAESEGKTERERKKKERDTNKDGRIDTPKDGQKEKGVCVRTWERERERDRGIVNK